MQLTGKQIAQICEALVDAFSKDTLRRLVRIELDQKLEAIADGENLSMLTFNLVSWAEQHGRIEDLIQGACRINGGNPQLQKLLQDSRAWPTVKAPRLIDLTRLPEWHGFAVLAAAFSRDLHIVAICSDDRTVQVWDVRTSRLLHTLDWAGLTVSSMKFSPDGNILVTGGGDDGRSRPILKDFDIRTFYPVQLWSVRTGEQLHVLYGHRYGVSSVAFSPSGRILASGGEYGGIHLWDVQTGALVNSLGGPRERVFTMAFRLDGNMLASSGHDKTVRLWDVQTGKLPVTLEGHTDFVYSIAFSPDGNTLASGSSDKTVRLWDVRTGKLLRTMKGHTEPVLSVAFSPNQKMLASGSLDNTVRLWDASTGGPLHTLEGHIGIVWPVAFSPDGTTLASGGDRTIRLWPVEG